LGLAGRHAEVATHGGQGQAAGFWLAE
jgi:hypothetical protein